MVNDRSTREMIVVKKLVFAILTIGALIGSVPVNGQLVGSVFGARARDSFGGTNGFGAGLGVSLPLLPLEVFGTGTLFRPDCSGCELKGWSLGVKFTVFPLPVLKPYVTLGRTWRDLEDPSLSQVTDDVGLFAGAGLEIGLPGVGAGIFAEGRYEFLTEPAGLDQDLKQWTLRAGLVVHWGGLPL